MTTRQVPAALPAVPQMTARRAYLCVAAVLGALLGWDMADGAARLLRLAGLTNAASPSVHTAPPGLLAAGVLALTAVTVWLCLAVTRRPGIGPYRPVGTGPGWEGAFVLSVAGLWVAAVVGAVLRALPGPQMAGDQADALGIDDPVHLAVTAVTASLREELPLVAVVVAVLAAAGRPAWEMYAVACVARVVPHAYMGMAALSVAVISAVNVWLYRRTGRITPLIAAHIAFDIAMLLIRERG